MNTGQMEPQAMNEDQLEGIKKQIIQTYLYLVSRTGYDPKVIEVMTWIWHESEAFICKALKGEAIVVYAEPLITLQMKASGSPVGWKLMR